MGGSVLTGERQLRGSSFTNVTARELLTGEEERAGKCTADVLFSHAEQPEINRNMASSKYTSLNCFLT